MKLAHKNLAHLSKAELPAKGKQAEAGDDFEKPEAFYQKLIKADPHNEAAYSRLMIIYRKHKEAEKKLQIIKKAIAAFEDVYASSVKTPKSKKISGLSNAFLKMTCLADKKGKLSHPPGPLATWSRRKTILEKKIRIDPAILPAL